MAKPVAHCDSRAFETESASVSAASKDPSRRHPVAYGIKRGADVVISGSLLLALAPALAAIGLLVRWDSEGPALFVQERLGKDGEVFRLYKFRSMTTGAPIQFNADGSTRVEGSDARVTRVGKYLRGALDELPQLVNVFLGQMSLIGPRPDLPLHAQYYVGDEARKLSVRPGISGLAAVIGRTELPWKTRIAIDLDYIDRWSLSLDAKIALATVAMALGRAQSFDFHSVTSHGNPPTAHPAKRSEASTP